MKLCTLCDFKAAPGFRFCARHRDKIWREMRRSSYLTPHPLPNHRTEGARENVLETKFGLDYYAEAS